MYIEYRIIFNDSSHTLAWFCTDDVWQDFLTDVAESCNMPSDSIVNVWATGNESEG